MEVQKKATGSNLEANDVDDDPLDQYMQDIEAKATTQEMIICDEQQFNAEDEQSSFTFATGTNQLQDNDDEVVADAAENVPSEDQSETDAAPKTITLEEIMEDGADVDEDESMQPQVEDEGNYHEVFVNEIRKKD